MLFTHDVEAGLASTAALVNTLPEHSASGADELATVDRLDAFIRGWGYTGSRTHTEAELRAVQRVRPRLRALWSASADDAVPLVNAMLADGRARPRLVEHDGSGWHVHATDDEQPLADRLMVEGAMAWVDVLRAGERERMRVCAADDCEAVLVDLSRNRSKRFCDVRNCGNRANVQAYRARKAAAGV